jgi:hypothetical protein
MYLLVTRREVCWHLEVGDVLIGGEGRSVGKSSSESHSKDKATGPDLIFPTPSRLRLLPGLGRFELSELS